MAIVCGGITTITPLPLWVRALLIVLVVTIGSYSAAYCLFHEINTHPAQ